MYVSGMTLCCVPVFILFLSSSSDWSRPDHHLPSSAGTGWASRDGCYGSIVGSVISHSVHTGVHATHHHPTCTRLQGCVPAAMLTSSSREWRSPIRLGDRSTFGARLGTGFGMKSWRQGVRGKHIRRPVPRPMAPMPSPLASILASILASRQARHGKSAWCPWRTLLMGDGPSNDGVLHTRARGALPDSRACK